MKKKNPSKAKGKAVRFQLTENSRFLIITGKSKDADLFSTVGLVRSEFARAQKPSGRELPVVFGRQKDAEDGDILIFVTDGYRPESFQLEIGAKIILCAGDAAGIFYGLREILKRLIAADSDTIPGDTLQDEPDVPERTVHLDCARKYFSPSWIKLLIRKMSWMRYNAIELHFSEEKALRLESRKFPWLTDDTADCLSQEEMRDICETAKKYHIEVIPSFDTPGHMDYIVKKYLAHVKAHPDYSFTYKGKTYAAGTKGFENISNYYQYKGERSADNNWGIDLANKTARAFTNALVDEYADLFLSLGSTKFNIGGDELLGWTDVTLQGKTFRLDEKWQALQHWKRYARKKLKIKNGSAADTFISYLNKTAKRLEKKGYAVRVWSDEIDRFDSQHISLKKSAQIIYWSSEFAPIFALKKKGYIFYNAVADWCYYVLLRDPAGRDVMDTIYAHVNGESIYNGWNPGSFSSPDMPAQTIPEEQYGGTCFCIWCDDPDYKSSSAVWKEISSRMWASSAKMWNPEIHEKQPYTDFRNLTERIDRMLGEPEEEKQGNI